MPKWSRKVDCSAVILAGGLNSRMQGRNKAFLEIGGRTILDRLLESLWAVFPEVFLVTRQPEQYAGYPCKVVEDIFPQRSSLTGIHAGLAGIRTGFGFMVPCDTPFLQTDLIGLMLKEVEPEMDVLVPYCDGHYQPLCAVYSKRCLRAIEEQLNKGDFKIINFFDRMNVKIVTLEKLKTADPGLLSFLNVNTPAAYDACRELAADLSKKKE